ncbi:hypothetical protein U6A24_21760 [Aquimarina gracilis]|uniref:Uncharacterized protein n=1 Tax=Aquimarina gracilis TaxID=874422 RepID=A0ABU6A1S6_9FLAO|nr:hypothetical protein [Aquimarina gracilis]MEB3348118.1 hypothetical protein [Aquimarina gracilis]
MSGEAGAGGVSKYCHIYYSSGMTVSVAAPPNVENPANYVSEYFKEANIPYQETLDKVLPELERGFEAWIPKYNLPIVPYNAKFLYLEGLIVEDEEKGNRNFQLEKEGKNKLVNSKCAIANIYIAFSTNSFKKIILTITINKLMRRSSINALKTEILCFFD